jgi:hypothetical protein
MIELWCAHIFRNTYQTVTVILFTHHMLGLFHDLEKFTTSKPAALCILPLLGDTSSQELST